LSVKLFLARWRPNALKNHKILIRQFNGPFDHFNQIGMNTLQAGAGLGA
jgi:hypothetical protein